MPDVESRWVSEQGLVGTLVRPVGGGPTPGVLLLGGSEGGLHERDARELAAEGFAVLALAYFGVPGLPEGLVEIPLEYFAAGLDVLADASGRGGMGVVGGSRGGEAALLVAAHDARVRAAVSVAGSGVVTQGIDVRLGGLVEVLATPTPAWTVSGRPLPYLPNVVTDELRERVRAGRPVRLRSAVPPLPLAGDARDRISIPVERTRAEVLMLAGSDDGMWPSAELHEVAARRLRRHGRHPVVEVLPGAGHAIAGPPGEGDPPPSTAPGPGVTFDLGGTPAVTHRARLLAWRTTVDFLRQHLLVA